MILTEPNRGKFLKILALPSSDKSGERDAAAVTAVRFLRQRGLTWDDIVARDAPAFTPRHDGATGHSHRIIQDCLLRPGDLRPWEAKFLHSLLGFARLSPKQATILREIAGRLGVVAERAA